MNDGSSHKVAAASVPMVFAGKTYYMSPMQDGDHAEWEAWIQDKQIAVAKRNLDGLQQEDRNALLTAAYEKASKITIFSPEAMDVMVTPDGAAKLIWLSLRHRHPDLEESQVARWCADHKILREALDKHDFLNHTPDHPKADRAREGARKNRRRNRKSNRSGHGNRNP